MTTSQGGANAYKKMMHSTDTRCVVSLCHITKGLRSLCKPYRYSSFFFFIPEYLKAHNGNLLVIYDNES